MSAKAPVDRGLFVLSMRLAAHGGPLDFGTRFLFFGGLAARVAVGEV